MEPTKYTSLLNSGSNIDKILAQRIPEMSKEEVDKYLEESPLDICIIYFNEKKNLGISYKSISQHSIRHICLNKLTDEGYFYQLEENKLKYEQLHEVVDFWRKTLKKDNLKFQLASPPTNPQSRIISTNHLDPQQTKPQQTQQNLFPNNNNNNHSDVSHPSKKRYLDHVDVSNLSVEQLWKVLEVKSPPTSYNNSYLSRDQVRQAFTNVFCPKKTAVELNGQFLHANYISFNDQQRFIASQAPFEDKESADQHLFWQVMFAKPEITTIIDLSNHKDRKGIGTYCPKEIGESQTYGEIEVTCTEIQKSSDGLCDVLTYQLTDMMTKKTKTLQRISYPDWPDGGVINGEDFQKLVDFIKELQGISVIHCRAGVGRTGTLITAILLQEMILKGEIDASNLNIELSELILSFREQRPLFVQTLEQFNLLLEFGKKNLNSKKVKVQTE